MGISLRGLNSFDVELDLLGNKSFMGMIEGEIKGDTGIRSLHAVDVGVNDLARDVQRQWKFGLKWHLDPEDSMPVQGLCCIGINPKADTPPTEIH